LNWFRAGGLLLGLAAGLLLAELMVRLFGAGEVQLLSKRYLRNQSDPRRIDYHCYPSNPHGEFSPHPDLTQGRWRLIDYAKRQYPPSAIGQTPWCVEYRLASSGMRDREHAHEVAPGTLRIAVVGDSFVFGEGVPQQLTLVDQLSRRLGDRYELLNVGAPGANTQQEVANARLMVPAYHCSRMIVVFTANDVNLTPSLARRENHINDLINIRDLHLLAAQHDAWYMGRSRLVRWIGSRLFMRRLTQETIRWYRDCYDPRLNGQNLQQMANDLKALATFPGCRAVLVLYPLLEQLEGAYPLAAVHDRVRHMAAAAGLPLLDLAPVFRGQQTRSLWVHDCDHHPNGRAHARAAAAIEQWLRDVPGFLELPAP
jgi:hypothetical protein